MGRKPTTNKALEIVTVNGVKADGGACGADNHGCGSHGGCGSHAHDHGSHKHEHGSHPHEHDCGHADHEHVAPGGTFVKVKFIYKLVNFCLAVFALSWFFEGWRQVNTTPALGPALILLAGTVSTILFLGIHSYWVYIEEKSKGTLKRHFSLFEKIYAATSKRPADSILTSSGKGEN